MKLDQFAIFSRPEYSSWLHCTRYFWPHWQSLQYRHQNTPKAIPFCASPRLRRWRSCALKPCTPSHIAAVPELPKEYQNGVAGDSWQNEVFECGGGYLYLTGLTILEGEKYVGWAHFHDLVSVQPQRLLVPLLCHLRRGLQGRRVVSALHQQYPPILYAPVPFGAERMVWVAQYREMGLNPVG